MWRMWGQFKRLGRYFLAVLESLDQLRLNHKWKTIEAKTPLLNEFDSDIYTIADLSEINSARRRCRTINHIWSLVTYLPTFPPTYVAECLRCYPHKDSRFTLSTDHLFDGG